MNKKIVFLAFLIVALIGIWFLLDFIQIGSGLPSPEAMPRWYTLDASKGNEHGYTFLFPKISPYCNSVNISEGKFINVWYFEDESKFLKGENILYRYLEENGNIFQQELNISIELQEKFRRDKANNSYSETFGSHSFNSTRYENP